MHETEFDNKILYDLGVITNLDYHLSRTLCRMGDESDNLVEFSCAMVSRFAALGHICLDIEQVHSTSIYQMDIYEKTPDLVFPNRDQWVSALKKSPLVSKSTHTPLVLDENNKLYFAKFYDFQCRLTHNIRSRVQQGISSLSQDTVERIEKAFSSPSDALQTHIEAISIQKKSVINALVQPFSIISGGPGTGKTYIINTLIQILGNRSKILCVAPTGKAAAKLNDGMTIHRALGFQERTSTFLFHKDHPLPVDVVVIDETSMVDIALMTRLLEAIPLSAKVVLIGDQHQLCSVETGAVFEDICRAQSMQSITTVLAYNFRSKSPDIDQVSKAIYHGDTNKVLDYLSCSDSDQVEFLEIKENDLPEPYISEIIDKGYQAFIKETDPVKSLEQTGRFKILCPTRYGPFGTIDMNVMCKKLLRSGLNFDIQDRFFKRAVMITKNDYQHNLFNGDTGVVFCDKDRMISVFMNTDNHACYFDPDTLSGIEDAFAITVHKSQGSEYDHVLLIVPPGSFVNSTRQLLYTGFTRAKQKVTLLGTRTAIAQACAKSTIRFSNITGMLDKLC